MEEGGEQGTYCVWWSCGCGVGGLGASGRGWVGGLDGLLPVLGGGPLGVVGIRGHICARLVHEIKNRSGTRLVRVSGKIA